MKKALSLALAATMSLSVAGCAKTQVQETNNTTQPTTATATATAPATIATEITEPVSFEFWHAMTGENEAVLKSLADKFNSQNAGKMTVNLVYQGHYKELFSKLEGAAKANTLPTLTMIYPNRLTAYVMSDFVENLNPYIENDTVGFSKEAWDNIPAFLRDNGMWDGIHYSLPFNKATYLLFYNEDLLKKYNVAPPKTWDELAAAAKKLTVTDNGKNVVGLALNKSVGVDSSFWVEQAGGHLHNEQTDVIQFNQEPGVAAYTFLTDMVKEGSAKICTEESYMTGPFGRGEAAMGISSMSALPDIIAACKENGVNFKTVVVPEGKQKAAMFSGTDVAIFNTSTPQQKLAAFEFLKFFYESENQFDWGTKSGYLPLNNAILKGDEFKKFSEENNPAKLTSVECFDYGFCDPKILNGYAIHDNMSKALDKILLEGMDVKQALDEAAAQARKEIEEARSSFQKMK